MLQLELPHLNVLSKVDLITQYGDLSFNLDYYTEVQDLSYLQYELDKDPRFEKFADLNKAICDLVEDFGLVGFETLAVEDKTSMLRLMRVVDKATGYIFAPPHASEPSTSDHSHEPATAPKPGSAGPRATKAPNIDALFSSAIGVLPGPGDVSDVQERWVDAREAWDEWEKEQWRKEGAIVQRDKAAREKAAKGLGDEHERNDTQKRRAGQIRERQNR